jgi:diaminohydroxyphosphoribosylaminopyrimidine deaminase/5-amino-6-(5-phosphoribosylamino)uracil reductase
MVEGGANLAGALLGGGFVDRLIIFQAPVLLGAGALPAFGVVSPGMGAPEQWRVIDRREFGDDLMTIYAPAGR